MTSLNTMYPGQINSPSTTLSGALSSTGTTVNVADASVLPTVVPFPLTIGIDSAQSETVLVTAINGNALTVTRGWDGTASAWSQDTPCARVFTARDLNDLQNNVTALNSGKAESSAVPSASTTTPSMDGTGSYGSGTSYARSNHVHPTDTSRQAKITASGLLKGDGNGGVTAAVSGADYAPASAIPSSYGSTPNMDGTGSAGSSSNYSRGDHTHPTDTSRQAKITASGLLKGDGNGGVTAAVAGTDYQTPLTAGTDYATPAALADYIPTSQKGANNGVASLTADGKVTPAQASAKIVPVSSNTSLGSSHAGVLITATGSITLTIPSTLDVGTEIEIMNYGTGTITVQASSGVYLNGTSAGSKQITDQYTSAVLKAIDATHWVIQGAIS